VNFAETRPHGRPSGVTTYLVLTFGLAWAPFIVVMTGGPSVGPVLMPVAPAVACVVVRRWVTREGFVGLGLRPTLSGVLRRWPLVALALLWPLAVSPVLALLSGADLWAGGGHLASWVALSLAVAPVILGEELGWRGYLQVRIYPGHPLAAAVATGVIWGVWHYPLLLNAEGLRWWLPVEFTVGTVTMSAFLGWLRTRSGSVWGPSLGHASNNVTEDNLTRHAFSTAEIGPGQGAAVLSAEAVVLLGIVGLDRWRRAVSRPSPRGGLDFVRRTPRRRAAQRATASRRGS
jgi:membrane protease YdiL (CAAX protease family)